MPVVKKVAIKKAVKKTVVPKKVARVRLALPKEKHQPVHDIGQYPIMIYGERKIGKTTLAATFEDNFFFMFEPNNSYELYKQDIMSWQDFLDLSDEIIDGDHDFKTVTIDTGEPAYQLAFEKACQDLDISHPTDLGYGKGWSRVRNEFTKPIQRLMKSRFGFIVLAHEKEKEIEMRSGAKYVKMCPDLSGQADQLFTGQIYNIFYYHFEENSRWLQIQGDEYITAGHRMKGHFLTTKGEKVFKIPMGTNEDESYKNLMTAYNNKQIKSFAPVKTVANKPKKLLKKKES